MPTANEYRQALKNAGIPELVARLKRDCSARGFDTSEAPSPISPANGELGFSCALPGVRFVVSIRENKKAKLLVTDASAAWLSRLGLTQEDQKGAAVPYWQPGDGTRRSIEEIVALLESYRNPAATKPAPESKRAISVEELIRFARDHHGQTFRTLRQKRPYRVCWEDDQVVFHPVSGTPFFPDLERYVEIYNQTKSLKPSDYPKELWCNSYFVSIVDALLHAMPPSSAANDVAGDIEIIAAASASATERTELIKCRLGQGKFRAGLLNLRGRCYVTGVTDQRLLRASHIKPWRNCTNEERLDPHNGLLLTPLYDHLFDQGLISFADDGTLLTGKTLPRSVLSALSVQPRFRGSDLGAKTRTYLAHHRAEFQQIQDAVRAD